MPPFREYPLEVLIVHDSRVIRKVITGYLLSDHPDARIDDADPSGDIAGLLNATQYDVVFSGVESVRMNAHRVREMLAASDLNRQARLVVMTTGEDGADSSGDFPHALPIPCSSTRFRDTLYRLFVPEVTRVPTVYRLPRTRGWISFLEGPVSADVIDISEGSVACMMDWDRPLKDLARALRVAVRFPADYGKASTIEMSGEPLSLKSCRPAEGDVGRRMRVAWRMSWSRLALHAATKKPLTLGLSHLTPPEAAGPHPIPPENRDKIDEPGSLSATERQGFLNQIRLLQARIADLEVQLADVSAQAMPMRTVVTLKATPTADERKRGFFKRIIEENIHIRDESRSGGGS